MTALLIIGIIVCGLALMLDFALVVAANDADMSAVQLPNILVLIVAITVMSIVLGCS